MADIIDRAQRQDAAIRQANIMAACYSPGRGPIYIKGLPLCRECGETIQAGRIAILPGVETCIECAKEKERNQ